MARSSITKRERKVNGQGTGKHFYEARVVTGTYPGTKRPKEEGRSFDKLRDAQQWARTRTAAMDQGIAVPRTKHTVADLLNYWNEHYVAHNVTPVTRENYGYTLKHLLESPLAGVLAQELKPEQVQRWYTQWRDEQVTRATAFDAWRLAPVGPKPPMPAGSRTLQMCHLRLFQAFKFALQQGLVGHTPMDAVRAPSQPRRSMTIWTIPEAQHFMRTAATSPYGPVYALILHLSLRRGEALGLRWRDVDLERGTVTIAQTVGTVAGRRTINPTPKNKSSNRTIALDADLITMLRAHKVNRPVPALDGSDYVCCARGGIAICPRNLVRDFEHWLAMSNLPPMTLHGLRHTSISHSLILGASLKAVSERAGHARVSTTTDIYQHVGWEQHADVSNRLGVAFGSKSTG